MSWCNLTLEIPNMKTPFIVGDKIRLKATLLDADGNPVPHTTIWFEQQKDGGGYAIIGSDKTGSLGIARIDFYPAVKGIYDFKCYNVPLNSPCIYQEEYIVGVAVEDEPITECTVHLTGSVVDPEGTLLDCTIHVGSKAKAVEKGIIDHVFIMPVGTYDIVVSKWKYDPVTFPDRDMTTETYEEDLGIVTLTPSTENGNGNDKPTCLILATIGGTALAGLLPFLRLFRNRHMPKLAIKEYYHISSKLAPTIARLRGFNIG